MYQKLLCWLADSKKNSLLNARLLVNPIYKNRQGSGYNFPGSLYIPVNLPYGLANTANWLLCKLTVGDLEPKPTLPSLMLGQNRVNDDAKLVRLIDAGNGTFLGIIHYGLQPTIELRLSLTETAVADDFRLEVAKLSSTTAQAMLALRIASEIVSPKESPTREVTRDLLSFTKVIALQGSKVASQAKDMVLGVTPINVMEPPPQTASEYEKWLFRQSATSPDIKRRARRLSDSFPVRPRFSIVMPVYKSNELFLREAVESVRRQIYTNWELLVVNDGSKVPELSSLLSDLAKQEFRVKVIELDENVGISEATNRGIEAASGDFIGFLDHDDILTDDALFWFADVVNRQNNTKVIYSDHDVYSESIHISDHYYKPYFFKPDWNPLLFLGQNYLNHFVAVEAGLAKSNPLRSEYNGSQDYDFLLRVTAQLDGAQIVHVPRILYHWRAEEGSVALKSEDKSYAVPAARRAVQDYLDQNFPGAKVEEVEIYNRIRFPVPTPPPSVAIVIPTKDGYELLKESIGTIFKHTAYPNFRIKVIDNQSSDPETTNYLDQLEKSGQIDLFHYDKPFNYSEMHNQVIEQLDEELVLLLNNDVSVISGDWLDEMVSLISKFNTAAVGCKLLYPDGTIQHAGVLVGLGGAAGHIGVNHDPADPGYFGRFKLTQNATAVTAACLLIKRDVYKEVGGMNSYRLGVAFNDVDLCLKINEAGYRIAWTPFATLIHHESKSRGHDGDDKRKINRMMGEISYLRERWESELQDDPNYNPNLEIMTENMFTPSKEPRIPTLADFVEACYRADGKKWDWNHKFDTEEEEEMLRHKYHIRIAKSPFEYRRKDLDD